MKRVNTLISALTFMMASVFGVHAADDDLVIPATQEDAYTPVEVGSGWYIRGDVGVNFGGKHNTDSYTVAPVYYDNEYRDAMTFGLGAGYRFNEYLRLDAGLEKLFVSNFESRRAIAPTGPCKGRALVDTVDGPRWVDADIDNCIEQDRANYSATVAMANAFVDLGTYSRFTPFLGAGIGVAHVSYSEEVDSITCVPVNPNINPEVCSAVGSPNQPALNQPYTEPGIVSSGTDWRFAYALSAGVSYDMTKNLKLDTIYRFSSIAGGSGIPYGPTVGSSLSKDGFSLHQIKMGLRYEIW